MKSKTTTVEAWIEYQRIVDKKSYFRASEPDVIYVRIMNRIPGVGTAIVREFVFEDATQAKAHYDELRNRYGLIAK